jgi:hypothetical protein
LSVKSSRNKGEYSWTCKGPALLYCFEKFGLSDCTYVDADMYFFSDPSPLYIENPDADVMLTDHRYTEGYNLAETNGKYCAGYMYFKSTPNGINVLRHWTRQCIDWCYGRHEPGRFGDQKYLDTWPQEYGNVYVCENLGAGVATWNIQSYLLESYTDNSYLLKTRNDKKHFSIVFYHYQGIQYIDDNKVKINVYKAQFNIDRLLLLKLYRPYLRKCNHFKKCLSERYGINTVIRSHPAFKKMTRRPLITILSELSFSNILYRFMLR